MNFNSELVENVIFTIYIVFLCVSGIQLIYYWGIFSRLAFYNKKNELQHFHPVSVVIAARNEYFNLLENLPLILEQDYPDFEVVVVNNSSSDESEYLLKELSEKYNNLKIATIRENVNFFKGKKFPLSVGIKSAKNEFLLLIDADCKPKSNKWIENMQSAFTDKTQIVLGYGPYVAKKGFLNTLIRFDTLQVAMQYLSYSLSGLTYMGVGRNLAYTKSLFYKNQGFSSHYKIMSGDDDLFINSVTNRRNTKIMINPESFTYSEAKDSFSSWIKQKKRHLSTGKYYKFKHKFLLGMYSLSLFLFYFTGIFLLILTFKIEIVASLVALKLISQIFIFKKCMIKLNEKNLLLISPILEIMLLIINPMLSFSNLIVKTNKWK
ncbi:MAG: glycosyltransferase [Saprospiraceae bacterium]|nr:glycosyltransferase [Saprospiraceae bacterium]